MSTFQVDFPTNIIVVGSTFPAEAMTRHSPGYPADIDIEFVGIEWGAEDKEINAETLGLTEDELKTLVLEKLEVAYNGR